ncbi:MAG: pyruvate ferredoxin oxidoreductase [Promethearchaeia archaeon]|nr:MAG: pyruvate ferredoxin oxidoreductase [Candidatus Lokiarchaeia archaeon]
MPEQKVLTGNHAAAYACKSANVEVVAAYPITPQSPVVEKISEFVEAGELPNTQFVTVESEQSAISAVVAASQMGARVFTASSANGLAYMYEILCWAAGSRLPLVMCIATRGLGAPWTVWTDHQDAFSMRDVGFIQQFVESNQEAYDTVLMSYRIAEDPRVYLPAFVSYDGYILSHTMMPVQIEDEDKVKEFLPPLKPHIHLTDFDNVRSVNPVTPPGLTVRPEGNTPGYYEFRYSMQKAHEYATEVVEEVAKEFEAKFGRSYGNGIYKPYKIDDAEVLIFAVASVASESRGVVDKLREEGLKVGLISLKLYRPFPIKHLREAFSKAELVVVFDRDVGYGMEGILAAELKTALYAADHRPIIRGFIVGLGGRDITADQLILGVKTAIAEKDDRTVQQNTHVDFIGVQLEELGFKKEGM